MKTKMTYIQVRLPVELKKQAKKLAKHDGDGDLSSWIRELIRAAWKKGPFRT